MNRRRVALPASLASWGKREACATARRAEGQVEMQCPHARTADGQQPPEQGRPGGIPLKSPEDTSPANTLASGFWLLASRAGRTDLLLFRAIFLEFLVRQHWKSLRKQRDFAVSTLDSSFFSFRL